MLHSENFFSDICSDLKKFSFSYVKLLKKTSRISILFIKSVYFVFFPNLLFFSQNSEAIFYFLVLEMFAVHFYLFIFGCAKSLVQNGFFLFGVNGVSSPGLVHELLIAVAVLVLEHRLWGERAQ